MLTLQFIGIDDWDRPVYRDEKGRLWKDLNLGNGIIDLYRAVGDDMDGEPDMPIKEEYIIVDEYKESPYKFDYMMLSRLKMDCDYFLGHGNRNEKNLWGLGIPEQIEEMKKLWNGLPSDGKPEWLTWEQILKYEKEMTRINCFHYEECHNTAAHELTGIEGEVINLCAECEKQYTDCSYCGNYGILDSGYGNMTPVQDGSGNAICFNCLENISK